MNKDKTEAVPSNRVIDSETLFQGEKILLIRHHDDLYRLMITRQGKLILNK